MGDLQDPMGIGDDEYIICFSPRFALINKMELLYHSKMGINGDLR